MVNAPIGIFDSGIGGLTVLRQLIKQFPNETFIYVGDSARAPWGNKDKALLSIYNDQIMTFLKSKGCKFIVVACNTSQSYFGDRASQKFNIPSIGLIEPTGKRISQISTTKEVAIFATDGTIKTKSYETAILREDPVTIVHNVPCPKLVPLIESKQLILEDLKAAINEYLDKLKGTHCDTIVYGCSHYPIIHPLIKSYAPAHIKYFIDPATCIVAPMKAQINALNLSADPTKKGEIHFHVSGDIAQFKSACEQFEVPITSLNKVTLD
ncbi:MAG: glutamate racemase [bacterium]|nr:glutamate racemase [bacterium]